MTIQTITVLRNLLAQVSVSPMQKDAEAALAAMRQALRELDEEAAALTASQEGSGV